MNVVASKQIDCFVERYDLIIVLFDHVLNYGFEFLPPLDKLLVFYITIRSHQY